MSNLLFTYIPEHDIMLLDWEAESWMRTSSRFLKSESAEAGLEPQTIEHTSLTFRPRSSTSTKKRGSRRTGKRSSKPS